MHSTALTPLDYFSADFVVCAFVGLCIGGYLLFQFIKNKNYKAIIFLIMVILTGFWLGTNFNSGYATNLKQNVGRELFEYRNFIGIQFWSVIKGLALVISSVCLFIFSGKTSKNMRALSITLAIILFIPLILFWIKIK